MAHGYLHEGYGMWGDYDPDQEGRDRDRDRWRDRDSDRDRGFFFEGRERDRFRGRDEGDREWFGGRERFEDRGGWEGNRGWPQRHRESGDRGMSRYGREHGFGGFQGDYRGGREQGGFGGFGDYDRGRRSFSSSQDDHYRSWRDRQMEALDRDYADYCREREQQFHQDFDSWRNQRRGSREPLQPGKTQSGLSSDPSGTAQMGSDTENAELTQGSMGAATVGTTSGRRR